MLRGGLRLPGDGRRRPRRRRGHRRARRLGRDRLPGRADPLATRLEEVRLAVADGADEIDMVISRDAYLSGDDARVVDEIEQIKDACGDAHLKVILETVELRSYDHVRHASMLAMDAGADFIKTSTGKAAGRDARRDPGHAGGDPRLHAAHGPGRGDEAGRRRLDLQAALSMLVLVKETLGDEWLTPTASASAPRRCSTTCCCSTRRRRPAATGGPRTSRRSDRMAETPERTQRSAGSTRRRRSPPTTSACATATGCSSVASSSSPRGAVAPTINPATEEPLAEVAQAARGRRARGGRGPRGAGDVGGAARPGARQVRLPDRAPDPGARAGAGDRRDAGRRQADQGVARRRRPAGRGALLLLRGLGRQAGLRPGGPRSRAARRRRPGHPVELPAADGGVEAGARAGDRQHGGAQAGRHDAADRAAARRDPAGGRAAGGRREHPARRRCDGRGAGARRRASTRSPSPARPRSAATSRRRWRARTSG